MPGNEPVRVPLASSGDLRALRWIGRLMTLAAIWPVWYAWFGEASFDWSAMLVGGPGVLIGSTLWLWSGYRLRNRVAHGPHEEEGVAKRPAKVSLGELMAERFDGFIASLAGLPATVLLAVATGLCAAAAYPQLARTHAGQLEAAVTYAIVFGLLALGWRAVRGPKVAATIAAIAGLAYVAKPWVAPMMSEYQGELHPFSPTSETHFYFLLPGLGLCSLAVILVTTIKVPVAPAPVRNPPMTMKLDPPRPKPPRPKPPRADPP